MGNVSIYNVLLYTESYTFLELYKMYQLQTGCNFKEIGVNQQAFTLYDFTHRFVYILRSY